jgi:thiol:disulfide interchange protein
MPGRAVGVLVLALLAGSFLGAAQVDPFAKENEAGATPAKPEAKTPPKAEERQPAPLPEEPPSKTKGKRLKVADLIDFTVGVDPKEVRRGQTFTLTISGKPKPGYHTYALTKRASDDQYPTAILYKPVAGLQPLLRVQETEPKLVQEGKTQLYEHDGPFTWTQEILVLPEAKPGPVTLPFDIDLQVCDKQCYADKIPLKAAITISSQEPVALTPELVQEAQKARDAAAGGGSGSGLLAFILAGVFWGFVSLITPCVFPMIPITVSFFLKQSEKEHHRPITMALVYCLTIIVVLTIAAVALLSFFRALSTSPTMNFVIGGLFIFFALSLFGMYDIELPSGLARFTSAREGRGGLVGTMFMALTFTIISFACVAPFLGGFGGTAVSSNLTFTHRVLGGLAFAATFASPFFILALFPSLLKKMPKSGSWLNTVKVVMGFLELAAALKFLRAGELVVLPEPAFLTYDLVLGLYIALSLLCGLYLLGFYRLPHDTPTESLSVPRMLFSFVFLGLALYLTPALFKYGEKGKSQRPAGTVFAWLDSFLLPDEEESDLPWGGNLAEGLKKARQERKLVFVDFTGKTCTNCRLNEQNVFTQATVKDLLKQYTLVQLYTDIVPRRLYPTSERVRLGSGTGQQRLDAQANLALQRDKFDTEQLPLYAILEPLPDGGFHVEGIYDEGKISNETAFLQFLERPLAARRASVLATVSSAGKAEQQPKQPPTPAQPLPQPIAAKEQPTQPDKALPWVASLTDGLRAARGAKRLVFVDFTGLRCPPCLRNERAVFTQPAVQELLHQFALVQLYTDEVPAKYYSAEQLAKAGDARAKRIEDARANLKFQEKHFDSSAPPLYVILEPQADGGFRVLDRFAGEITNQAAFLAFLQRRLQEHGNLPPAQASLKNSQ